MAGNPTSRNLIAVVIGAVILFGAISVIPIIIMRRHRSRAAERHANELHCLEGNGTMRQVTVQRWLDQQTTSEHLERYAGESCPICLTSLLAPPALSLPSSTTQNQNHQHQRPTLLPLPPAAAHISHPDQCTHPHPTRTDDGRIRLPRGPSPSHHEERTPESVSTVLILNRCNHAFHTDCLASWFEYRQYRCPICSDVLFSE
ncbi:hypothetical protein BDW59DRAFT_50869 [Aspergillus cavernicola]|uniref:RING-type domain-containing protein n=1 Tax=Aspergillus cavernicola TaxID=176166 RepID=A0ABR4IK75_9EURO